MRRPAAVITAAVSLVLAGCRAASETPSPPWPQDSTAREKAAALATYIDSHVGTPFPDLTLTDLRTGKTRTLSSLGSTGRLLLLNHGGGCPFADADIAYFRSVDWQVPGADHVVVLVEERSARRGRRPDTGAHPHVYTTSYPLPGWMARVRGVPQTYFLDAKTRRVVRWTYHLDEARRFFPKVP